MGKEMRAQFVPENLAEVVNATLPVPPVSDAARAGWIGIIQSRRALNKKTGQTSPTLASRTSAASSLDLETIASLVAAAAPPPLAPPASAPRSSPRRTLRGGGVTAPSPAAAPHRSPPSRTSRPRPSRAPSGPHPLCTPRRTAPPMFSHALAHPESTIHAPDSPDAASSALDPRRRRSS